MLAIFALTGLTTQSILLALLVTASLFFIEDHVAIKLCIGLALFTLTQLATSSVLIGACAFSSPFFVGFLLTYRSITMNEDTSTKPCPVRSLDNPGSGTSAACLNTNHKQENSNTEESTSAPEI